MGNPALAGFAPEWYHLPTMKGLPAETDFVVIGAGVAGLRAAIELAAAGHVLVLTKKHLKDPGTAAAPLSDEDEISLHLQDSLLAGDGLCLPEAVKTLVEESPARIEEVIAWCKPLGIATKLVFGSEASYKHSHILRAPGDSAAGEIRRLLHAKASSLKHISVREFQFSTELEIEDGRVRGISLINDKGLPEELTCSAVLLASGGLGQLYRNTTNSADATADGVALAFRAGAEIADLELIQFHPTALHLKKAPRFPLSEALRAEGAFLRNIEMDGCLGKYHPLHELAANHVG